MADGYLGGAFLRMLNERLSMIAGADLDTPQIRFREQGAERAFGGQPAE